MTARVVLNVFLMAVLAGMFCIPTVYAGCKTKGDVTSPCKKREKGYVADVVNEGWMSMMPDGEFHEELQVNRAQLATIVSKAFDVAARKPIHDKVEVKDVPESHWAYESIQTMLTHNIMVGYRNSLFHPDHKIDRAEGFAIMAQGYGVLPFEPDDVDAELAKYTDGDKVPDWSKGALATAIHEGWIPGDTINPDAPLTRGDVAKALSHYYRNRVNPPHSPKGL